MKVEYTDVSVTEKTWKFTIKSARQTLRCEINLGKDAKAKTFYGEVHERGDVIPAEMERTAMTGLDRFEILREAIALGVDPESCTVFLPALLGENSLALLGGEFQRVVLLQEVFHRVEVGTQRRIIGHRQRRRFCSAGPAHIDDLLPVNKGT